MALVSFFLPNTDNCICARHWHGVGEGAVSRHVRNQQLQRWWKMLMLRPPGPPYAPLKRCNSSWIQYIYSSHIPEHMEMSTPEWSCESREGEHLLTTSVSPWWKEWHRASWKGMTPPPHAAHALTTIFHLPNFLPHAHPHCNAEHWTDMNILFLREKPNVLGNHDRMVRNKHLTKGEADLVFVNVQWLWWDFACNPHNILAEKALLSQFCRLRCQVLERVRDLPPTIWLISNRGRTEITFSVSWSRVLLVASEHPGQVARHRQRRAYSMRCHHKQLLAVLHLFPWQIFMSLQYTLEILEQWTKQTQFLVP